MSRKSRKQPYSEYINLTKELREYRKLCRGKSNNFTFYLDWKEHIITLLKRLDSDEKKENFMHYLVNNKRVNKNANSYFVTIMIFCLNTYFNRNFVKDDLLMTAVFIVVSLFQILFQSDYYNKEYCFYCDLIEILNEVSNNNKEVE